KSIPPVWDETIVLPPSEIGQLAAFARRSGKIWFLAVLNGPEAKQMHVPLAFLNLDEQQALLVRDDPQDPAAIKMERSSARGRDTLSSDLAGRGGFIGRFSPQ